jgi:hypothetical protein
MTEDDKNYYIAEGIGLIMGIIMLTAYYYKGI